MARDPRPPHAPDSTSTTPAEWPSQYVGADCASQHAQRCHIRLQFSYLTSIVLAAIVSLAAVAFPNATSSTSSVVSASILVIGLVLTSVSRALRYDNLWSDCRAIAESTKTAAWKYIMRVAPFDDDDTAHKVYTQHLHEIRSSRPTVAALLGRYLPQDPHSITTFMTNIRGMSFSRRREQYLLSRLRDQKQWYSTSASTNSRRASHSFLAVVLLQATAVLYSISRISSASLTIDLVPLLMTLAASVIAWSNLKRYQELGHTYSCAAQELADHETLAANVNDESTFIDIVSQTEGIISREHTIWSIRRNSTVSPVPM
ncbi:MAG: DUF4231 domain-containing protein [Gammaproteobacteria bacterium]|nr:DUF4231 domain-containing protein [Gammaproteobacteria bacterium]